MANEILMSLLSPEQRSQAQEDAFRQGLLGLSTGLIQAAFPQGGRRTSTLQALAQAAPGAVGAYKGAFDQTLKDLLTGMQVKDAMDKRKREEALRKAVGEAYTMQPVKGLGLGPEQVTNRITEAEIEAFGPTAFLEAAKTVAPMTRTFDQAKYLEAVRQYDPMEYAKLMFKENKVPEAIQTLEILATRPDLLKTELARKAAGATNVSVGDKNEMAMFKEIDLPILQGFQNSATSSREFAQTAETINRLLKGKGGGDVVKIGTELAKNLGLPGEAVAAQDLANSLVVQLAPRMRAPGSGSTSDIEFKSYISAVPSLSNSEAGREIMAKSARAFAERNAKLADYAREQIRKGTYSNAAMQAYDQSLGPILGDDFYKAVGTAQPAASTSGVVDFRKPR